ncbi:MAG: D-alanyl-D-alanine carboxypeptidase [Firmicutes bacterium]|nr:D-alanyl-D-alanine carboxypeptidase [Bacillota bacterium]
MQKIHLYLLIILSAMFIIYPAQTNAAPELEAESAILVNMNTGAVLFEQRADEIMYPASTTKIMTALLAVEYGKPDELVTVGTEVLTIPLSASKAGILVGDQITMEELLYGLMLPSGNDVAYTIAIHLARSLGDPELNRAEAIEFFTEMMTERARELGATNTNFANPDGFHHPDHYSTARDMALITKAAMEHPLFRDVVGTGHHTPENWTGPEVRPWGNGNQLIRSHYTNYYEKATGGKTGYTPQAGFTLVATAQQDAMELVSVVLNTTREGRWSDSVRLLEYGFENYTYLSLLSDNQMVARLPVTNQAPGEPNTVDIIAAEGFDTVLPVQDQEVKTTLNYNSEFLDEDSERLKAPLTAGQIIGELVLSVNDQELHRTSLLAEREIAAYPWWRRLFFPGAATFVGTGLIFIRRRTRRARRSRYRSRYLVHRY